MVSMSSLPDHPVLAAKTPPKHVPVLTRVAQLPEGHPSGPAPLAPSSAPSPLTATSAASAVARPTSASHAAHLASALTNLANVDHHTISLRVLQRVDTLLERRIRDAVTAVALDHARAIADDMRPVIEAAVREAVNEALALEADRLGNALDGAGH